MGLKDSGVMPRHGCIITGVGPKQYFHVYLKEIEFRFNNREKDIFYELSKLMIKSAPTM